MDFKGHPCLRLAATEDLDALVHGPSSQAKLLVNPQRRENKKRLSILPQKTTCNAGGWLMYGLLRGISQDQATPFSLTEHPPEYVHSYYFHYGHFRWVSALPLPVLTLKSSGWSTPLAPAQYQKLLLSLLSSCQAMVSLLGKHHLGWMEGNEQGPGYVPHSLIPSSWSRVFRVPLSWSVRLPISTYTYLLQGEERNYQHWVQNP